MLDTLERIMHTKRQELRQLEQCAPMLKAAGIDEQDWKNRWLRVLNHTIKHCEAWRTYLQSAPRSSEAEEQFTRFEEEAKKQSVILTEQLRHLQPVAEQQADSQPEQNRQEHVMTGEGSWSQPTETGPKLAPPVPIGQHTLPPLPYPYNALEPYIDEQTMRLHHDKHHRSYVDGLNQAEKKMAEARKNSDFSLIKHWEREAAFHGAGHYLHTIFWNIMSPQGGGKPDGKLARQIDQDFGSFEAFKKHFSQAAEKVEGGGWAILVWSPRSGRLEILQAEKHQNLSQWDVIPLLVLDVWEHAYYLKYQNNRAGYIEAWWNIVNWPHVAERYEQASRLRWTPY